MIRSPFFQIVEECVIRSHSITVTVAALVATACYIWVRYPNPRTLTPAYQYFATHELRLVGFRQDWGRLSPGLLADGSPTLNADGEWMQDALGTHANSEIHLQLQNQNLMNLGITCEYPRKFSGANLYCSIESKGETLAKTPLLSNQNRIARLDTTLSGVAEFTLRVQHVNHGQRAAHAVWKDLMVHE